MPRLLLASAALALCAVPLTSAAAQTADAAGGGVGTEFMVFEVETSEAAKEHFRRGLALLHNFEYGRAAAAFRESQEADPGFAMAYWGEAMTHNHPLWEEQDRDAARDILARLAPTTVERAAKARGPREKAWMDALETLYAEDGTKEERDHAYLAKMRAMLAMWPDDIDVRAFTGLAVLGTSHGGRDIALYMEAAGILEPGFMTHEQHPGILHYLIHSYDDPIHAPLGRRMAQRYAKVAPDAGHAQHMISHIFHALADWEASEEANILADAVVDRQRAAAGRGPAHCGHYNEWLVYALLQQGKDASERVALCRADADPADGEEANYGAVRSYSVMAAWQAVDTGIWPEPLGEEANKFRLPRITMTHVAALQHRGDAEKLASAVSNMRLDAEQMVPLLARTAPDDRTTMPWVERAVAQVDALLMLASGDTDAGIRALYEAARAESALPVVFGPPAIAKPSWELLGEELLALGRKADAAEAFRHSLEFAPGRKLSLEGLARVEGG
ncbi:MAG: hypothetical protein ACMUJI_14195 [Erythrobacter sp.]|uniref:hypothetical protein n=1 Tax=Erythrobacter sp. TaxID=1042 RepID=UPI003A873F3F